LAAKGAFERDGFLNLTRIFFASKSGTVNAFNDAQI